LVTALPIRKMAIERESSEECVNVGVVVKMIDDVINQDDAMKVILDDNVMNVIHL